MNIWEWFNWADFWREDFWLQTFTFLSLTFRALGIALLISIPLGIFLTRVPHLAAPLIQVLGLIQTIPSLAFLGFFVSLLQIVGPGAAITAAVIYSIFPMVLNTYTGILQVDPRLRDAARGMGMTDGQILRKVELPLAMPVIMAGIRTGAVYAIGMITICAIVGSGGLGEYILRGMSRGDTALTLLGVIPILLLTALLFVGLGQLAKLARKNSALALKLAGWLVVLMAVVALGEPLLRPLWEQARESLNRTTDFWQQTIIFISLAVRGLGLSLLVGIPAGIVLTRFPKVAQPIINSLALIQTVPSLALLGLFASLFSLFGSEAAIVATVVYSLFPIVLNTYTGIVEVDPRLRDAARGMGMNDLQRLWKVELPLAMPVIMAGVRTGAAYAIIMVTIGALVGANGLGGYIVFGMARADNALILLGVVPILLLSLLVFFGLSELARLTKKNPARGQVVATGLILLMSGFAVAEPFLRPKQADIKLGAKNFTENLILAHIMKIMIETHTDLTVELFPNLGSNYGFRSLLARQLNMYPEYTGTLLTAGDALNMKVPKDKSKITELVREEIKKKHNLALLGTFGLNNTYVLVLPKDKAEKYQLKKVSDLKKVPHFRIVVDQEFLDRPDGWAGLVETYGFAFDQQPKQFDPNFLFRSLEIGKADLVIGFATQWQIKAYDLAVLEDDRGYFPSYHAAPLVRQDLLDKHPEIAKVLSKLENQIDDDTMRALNYEVAVNKRLAAQVAREFLQKKGLIVISQGQ